MAQERYFEKFPVIEYAGNMAVDLTVRITLMDVVSQNPYIYYPYQLSDSERAEQFSYRYYDDSYKSWIIYLTNKIVDPYHEWYLSQEQFNEFITKKYNLPVETLIRKVKFYRTNWETNETISVSRFNSLPIDLKQYWIPNYGQNNIVISYNRNQKEITSTTNKLVTYNVSDNSFIKDEICKIVLIGGNAAKGQIAGIADGKVYVHHLSGSEDYISFDENSYIVGEESSLSASISGSQFITQNISDEASIYWSEVSYYDFENERNEYNKSIRVLQKNIAPLMANNLRDLLKV
jgi:hypothetical protein